MLLSELGTLESFSNDLFPVSHVQFPILVWHLIIIMFFKKNHPSIIEICLRSHCYPGLLALRKPPNPFVCHQCGPLQLNRNRFQNDFSMWWLAKFAAYLNHLGAFNTEVRAIPHTNEIRISWGWTLVLAFFKVSEWIQRVVMSEIIVWSSISNSVSFAQKSFNGYPLPVKLEAYAP